MACISHGTTAQQLQLIRCPQLGLLTSLQTPTKATGTNVHGGGILLGLAKTMPRRQKDSTAGTTSYTNVAATCIKPN
jgi:hypothetical protein